MPADKPTALDKEIGDRLRARRQRAGFNGSELTHRLGWTATKTSRIETGVRTARPDEIMMYLASCGAGQTEVDAVLELAAQRSRYRAIDHTDTIRDATNTLTFHEGSAVAIRGYEPSYVPALLRTERYARAQLIESGVCASPIVEHRLAGLELRQAILQKSDQPTYTWYVHENVLHTTIGDNLIMNEQLLHLTFLGSWKRCTIRVIPCAAKSTGLLRNGFQRLTFTDIDPLVTIDLETNTLLLDDPTDTTRYREALERFDQVALTEDDSTTLIANQADAYDANHHVNLPARARQSAPHTESRTD